VVGCRACEKASLLNYKKFYLLTYNTVPGLIVDKKTSAALNMGGGGDHFVRYIHDPTVLGPDCDAQSLKIYRCVLQLPSQKN
jgi:hypothetical protein